MYIKFLDKFICVNKDKISVVNREASFLDKVPRVDGELKLFEGADSLCFSNSLCTRLEVGTVLEVSSYSYDESTGILDFTLHHNCTNNKICTDLIDITTWRIHSISRCGFEILED